MNREGLQPAILVKMPDHFLTYTKVKTFRMPPQPAWFAQLPAILEALRAYVPGHLDRQAVQKLLGVGERRARQLMAGLPGLRVGNAVAVERMALLARLEALRAGERFQWEARRRERLSSELERARRAVSGRRVRIPLPEASVGRPFGGLAGEQAGGLAPAIRMGEGELRVRFTSAEDLAARLLELAEAMAGDWEGFLGAVERAGASLPNPAEDRTTRPPRA